MKKTLFVITLLISAMTWTTSSARWVIGQRITADQVKAGQKVIIEAASTTEQLGKYLKAWPKGDKNLALDHDQIWGYSLGLNDDAIWELVDAKTTDVENNHDTYYLKMVNDEYYIGHKTSENRSRALVTNSKYAMNFSILNTEEGGCTQAKDYGWDEKSVVFSYAWGTTNLRLDNWYNHQEPMIYLYGSLYGKDYDSPNNMWNMYEAIYENSPQDDLMELIDSYVQMPITGGTNPGEYETEAYRHFEALLEQAMITATVGTDTECDSMLTLLKDTRKTLDSKMIPITEGLYYFINGMDDFLNEFEVEKAAYADPSKMNLCYKTFDPSNIEFVFYVSPAQADNEFWVEHYATGLYVGTPAQWYNSTPQMTKGDEEAQYIWLKGYGKWYWGSHTFHSCSYTPYPTNTPVATDTQGTLSNWGGENNAANNWRMRRVTDETLITQFEKERTQQQLDMRLAALIDEGNKDYAKLFVYTPDTDNPLITKASSIEGEENQITFSNIRRQGVTGADTYDLLIDKNDTTYMQGSGYIDIDISKTPTKLLTVQYDTRQACNRYPNAGNWGASERPDDITVMATNDPESGWTKIGSLKMGTLPRPATASIDLGQEYSHIRLQVNNNASGGSFFTISQLQLYKANIDMTQSQYSTTEGMSIAADALKSQLTSAQDKIESKSSTEEDIKALRDAIDAINNLYADTTNLRTLINECITLAGNTEIGEGMGQLPSEQSILLDNLNQAIANANTTGFVTPVSLLAIKTATASLSEAQSALKNAIRSIEPGKWYYITNTDLTRFGELGNEDAYCHGNAIYFQSSSKSDASISKWGFFNQTSQELEAQSEPKAMWTFIPLEGTKYYAVLNMYNGYYLGAYDKDDYNLEASETPVPYEIQLGGHGQFQLIPRNAENINGRSLFAEGYERDIVLHQAGSAGSYWTFEEIIPEEQEAIAISDFKNNSIDVLCLPYEYSNLSEYNDDVITYGIRKITQEEDTEGNLVSTIELYEKNEFKAGEPCIIAIGNLAPEAETEDFNLVLPFPATFSVNCQPANGIVGNIHSTDCEAGTAISDGKQFFALPVPSTFTAFTGVIDPATYKGEVSGVETALTWTFTGLNPIPAARKGDVNGDGLINATDVVCIYNYILLGQESGFELDDADLDGNGQANAADVVTAYNYIINGQ